MSKSLQIQVLTRARELIADRARWCKKMMAYSSIGGERLLPWDKSADMRCALGAISCATYEFDKEHAHMCSPLYQRTVAALADTIDPNWRKDAATAMKAGMLEEMITKSVVANFNDDKRTSHADVLAKFDEALK